MTGLELAHCMGPGWGRVQLKMPSVQVTELEAQPKQNISMISEDFEVEVEARF